MEYENVLGGRGFGERNETGEKVLGFVATYVLVKIKAYFRKK